MSVSEVDDDQVMDLARAAINKSGNHFFQTLITRTQKILNVTDMAVEDFEQTETLCANEKCGI